MIRKLLRTWAIHLIALFVTAQVITGFKITGGIQTYMVAGLVFCSLRLFFHPVLKVLLIPINLLTLQLAALTLHIIALYALVALVPQITITSFLLPSYSISSISLPQMYFTQFMTVIASSFSLSIIARVVTWFFN